MIRQCPNWRFDFFSVRATNSSEKERLASTASEIATFTAKVDQSIDVQREGKVDNASGFKDPYAWIRVVVIMASALP